MFNYYEELQVKLLDFAFQHQRALDSGQIELAKYFSKQYDETNEKIEKYEKENGLI